MLQGTLSVKNVGAFTVFSEEYENIKRLDIAEYGSQFQIDYKRVLYSHVISRKFLRYGDVELYQMYRNIVGGVKEAITKIETDISLDESTYDLVTTESFEDDLHTYKRKIVNGIVKEELYVKGEDFVRLKYMLDSSKINLTPINITEYEDSDKAINKNFRALEDAGYIHAEQLKAMYNLKFLESKNMRFIDDNDTAWRYIKEWKKLPKLTLFGVDFETTTLDMHKDNKDAYITGLVVSPGFDESHYFPFNQLATCNLDFNLLEELLRAVELKETVAHNKSFEEQCLHCVGLEDIQIKYDSALTAKVATGIPLHMKYDLKSLYYNLTGNQTLSLKQIFGSRKQVKFNVLDKDTIVLYACPDGFSTTYVHNHYWKMCTEKQKKLLMSKEYPLTIVKANSIYYGVKQDRIGLSNERYYKEKDSEKLEKAFQEEVGMRVNMNSPTKLEDLIYNRMKAPAKIFTKGGSRSTGKNAIKYLTSIKDDNPKDVSKYKDLLNTETGDPLINEKDIKGRKYPELVLLSEYKKLEKVLTSYYGKFIDNEYYNYHPKINQLGARTGRQTSDLQQIPKSISKFFVPSSDEYVMLDADWSQVELRILFYVAGQKNLFQACQDHRVDLHRKMASEVTGIPEYLITDTLRKFFKTVNFSIVYSVSERGLAEGLYGLDYTQENLEEAGKLISDFFAANKRIALYFLQQEQQVLKSGRVYTNDGRMRSFPDIYDNLDNNTVINSIKRQAKNMPIQGTAADIMKSAEIKVFNEFLKRGWLNKTIETENGLMPKARIIMSIHDELLIEFHKSLKPREVLKIVYDAMMVNLGGVVPLYPAMGLGRNWKEAKGGMNELPVSVLMEIFDNEMEFSSDIDSMISELVDLKIKVIENELTEYMEGVVEEAKEKKVEPYTLVTDPIYAIKLMEAYPCNAEDNKEKIEYAVTEYFKHSSIKVDKVDDEMPEDFYDKNQVTDDLDDAVESFGFDDEDVILESSFEEEEVLDDQGVQIQTVNSEDLSEYFIESLTTLTIDMSCVIKPSKEFLTKVDEVLLRAHDPKGIMSVNVFTHSKKIVETEYRIENVKDIIDIIDIIKSKVKEEKVYG